MRSAIEQVNADGGGTINFGGPMTIEPGSQLDAITAPDVSIVGPNSGQVVISGVKAAGNWDGLVLEGNNDTLHDLVINGWLDGVWLLSDGNSLTGNYIGTNGSGNVAVPNQRYGVLVQGSNNTIGGAGTGNGNVISGNGTDPYGFPGIEVESDDNLVQGNLIGTDATGEHAVGNGGSGIVIYGSGNTIGGTVAPDRNIISDNGLSGYGDGVVINDSGAGSTDNVVSGNFIGTDATGTAALGNADTGVLLESIGAGVSDNTIGGTSVGAGNVISGNGYVAASYVLSSGVELDATGVTHNLVAGNFIGTDAAGNVALANRGCGVIFYLGASDNTIGGTAAGAGNVIAFNQEAGLDIQGDSDGILGNAIYSNPGGGIVLENGANDNQQAPTVTLTESTGGGVMIDGLLSSSSDPNMTFLIEFFASPENNNPDEGQTYLGFLNVTTNAQGLATFSDTISAPQAQDQSITATATDPSNDTSEFSASFDLIMKALQWNPSTADEWSDPQTEAKAGGVDVLYTISGSRSAPGRACLALLDGRAHLAGIDDQERSNKNRRRR